MIFASVSVRSRAAATLALAACFLAPEAGEAEPICVPELFFDLAPEAAAVLRALRAAGPGGDYDEPVQVTRSSDAWRGAQRSFAFGVGRVSTLFIDIGFRGRSTFIPSLREEPRALLVGLATSCSSLAEVRQALQAEAADVLDRTVLLPAAAAREPGVPWGFVSTCSGRLVADDDVDRACVAEGPRQVVPMMSLDALLGLVLGPQALQNVAEQALPELNLKIDALGADVEVLESLRMLVPLLTRVQEVQMRVPSASHDGQLSRRDVLERMRMLGFHLQHGLISVQAEAGGEHAVHLGCHALAEEPHAEQCFFHRADAASHLNFYAVMMSRPYEILRTYIEGTNAAGSYQTHEAMRNYQYACESTNHFGNKGGVKCQLRGPMAGLLEDCLYIWAQVREMPQIIATRILVASWPLLTEYRWEWTHGAGVAFLLFTLIVEAFCQVFAVACASEQIGGLGMLDQGPPCLTLSRCCDQFRSMMADIDREADAAGDADRAFFIVGRVLRRSEVFLPLFRAAQHLAASPCAPAAWSLELDKEARDPFPTDLSSDGSGHATVVAVDSTACTLDVSVLVLSANPANLIEMLFESWSQSGMARPVKTYDFRPPTFGEDWVFDCLYSLPGRAEERRKPAETMSFHMTTHVHGFHSAPILSVRCEFPLPAHAGDTQDDRPTAASGAPTRVRLVRSARAKLEMPELVLDVPLRPARSRPVRTAVCTQQSWGYEDVEQRVPGHVETWFRYYLDVLGVDVVYLYDLDGSFDTVPFLRDYRASGRIVYEGGFRHIKPLDEVFDAYGFQPFTTYLAQGAVQHHCWQQARHHAEWVISFNHGLDMFLFSPRGESLSDLLQRLNPNELNYIDGVRYGPRDPSGQARLHPNVLGRSPFHLDLSMRPDFAHGGEEGLPVERIVIARPQLVDGAILSDVHPRSEAPMLSNLLGRVRMPHGRRQVQGRVMAAPQTVDNTTWRANHYVQLFSDRVLVYDREEVIPQLRAFDIYDRAAAELADRLAQMLGRPAAAS